MQAAIEELQPKIEKILAHKLDITFATAAILAKRIESGETPDLMILTQQSLEPLVKAGKAEIFAGSVIARSGMSVAVKHGAPKPDISTPDAFKRGTMPGTPPKDNLQITLCESLHDYLTDCGFATTQLLAPEAIARRIGDPS